MEEQAQYDAGGPVMVEPIDRKYIIKAYNPAKGDSNPASYTHTEHDSVLFLAKDAALPDTLRFYRQECERRGAAQEQLFGIDLLIMRVEKFQELNMNIVKVPDVELGNEAVVVLAENKQ